MHIQKECITKYNVQYNTHVHTPVNKSLPQKYTDTKHSPLVQSLFSIQIEYNPSQF